VPCAECIAIAHTIKYLFCNAFGRFLYILNKISVLQSWKTEMRPCAGVYNPPQSFIAKVAKHKRSRTGCKPVRATFHHPHRSFFLGSQSTKATQKNKYTNEQLP
jgi:hypothetical protein